MAPTAVPLIHCAAFLAASLLVHLLTACDSLAQSPVQSASRSQIANAPTSAPAWVTGDCRQHFVQQQVICGVGTASGFASASRAKNAAMVRGRAEIAQLLQMRVKSILTDYQNSSGAVDGQAIEENSNQITEISLNGTRVAEHWIAPDGTFFALMVLGIDDFKSSVQEVFGIAEPARQAVLQNAPKAFAIQGVERSRT
jgi:hypothetical protein